MKIGIVTMPICANYGGILQNWALQQILFRMGHNPITLRFPVEYQGMSDVKYWLRVYPTLIFRFIAHKLLGGTFEKPLTIGSWRRNISGMERFIDEHIYVTDYLPDLSMEDVRRYGVEVLLVGSDQIWRPIRYDAVKYYFLGFSRGFDIPRIAYAPSIALNEWPFDEFTTLKLKDLIKGFDAVSVREKSSVQLVQDYLNTEAQWVVDPTLLLQREDYLKICDEVPRNTEPFVFAYILDMTNEKRLMAEQAAMLYGCKVRYLTSGKVRIGDTIEKWIAYFRDAQFIITDSFHGTVFAMIFHKQFYCIYNDKRGNARMDTLRDMSNLPDRFLQCPSDISDIPIDYVKVDKNIRMMRESSLTFLSEALSKSISR